MYCVSIFTHRKIKQLNHNESHFTKKIKKAHVIQRTGRISKVRETKYRISHVQYYRGCSGVGEKVVRAYMGAHCVCECVCFSNFLTKIITFFCCSFAKKKEKNAQKIVQK